MMNKDYISTASLYDSRVYLAHHGIKGQRWGIRRYQNPDGTLTEEGKKKYGTVSNFNKILSGKNLDAKEQKQRDKIVNQYNKDFKKKLAFSS